ncbi:glutaredoxin [Vibrio cholerae]|uniref:Glutaredoxin n=2 Tax=Vibrio cholerae TaxID=666 RepID=A0A543Y7M2_VIBCL|nr:glutaredoxin [Vibrio cholerae]TQP12347.1 glutaredoxin [Vibrio cholerae]
MRIRNHLMTTPIKVTLYRWAGHFGPFKINIPCGECTLTKDILADTFANELAGVPIELEVKDWLSYWWEPLKLGAWHAPIVVVAGKVISQGEALNRGVLVQSIIKEWTKQDTLQGNIVFGKATCPYCVKAKQLLDTAGIDYRYHDVVKESAALYRMIPEVKAIIGEKTPVTVPQIWLNGQYIGGCDALEKWLQNNPHALPDNVVEIETTRVAP